MSRYAEYGQLDSPQTEEGDAFFHGVNQRLAADKLSPGVLADGRNLRMRDGEAETRKGVTKPGWLNVTRAEVDSRIGPVAGFYGVGVFKDPDSFEWVLTAAEGNIYRHKAHNARFALSLPTGVEIRSRVTFCQAFNKVWCFRGRNLQPLVMRSIDTGFVDVVARWSSTTVYNTAVLVLATSADEVAYGPWVTAASVTSVGTVATVVTTAEHGYVSGADITVSGAVQTVYNGRFTITVVDVNTFTYNFCGGVSPATGTIKITNQSNYWKALGTRVQLTSLTNVGTTATAIKNGHGFSTGQYVTISGVTPVDYNGTYVITVVDVNTFTYVMASAPAGAGGGVMLARTSVVLAGQSPDTNPEAWQRVYNILPNADDALFINNRLLVPTAYTPGATGYDSTSVYTKKDFIVATDIQDDVHFDFSNEFRINQGSDDEIVQLLKYTADTVLVFKEKSWGILTGVSLDLSLLSLDMRGDRYGACARGAVVAGRDVLFPSSRRGICSLTQNTLGQVRSVDVPFSNDVSQWVKRIDWRNGDRIRLAWWDDRLYAAVPLDEGSSLGAELVEGLTYAQSYGPTEGFRLLTVTVGARYRYTAGNSTRLSDGYVDVLPGEFVATTAGMAIYGPAYGTITASLRSVITNVNNAVLVYDFRAQRLSQDPGEYDMQSGQWASLDEGEALCVREFFKATWNGEERLFFIAEDGYVNLMEEGDAGDQVRNDALTSGLEFAEIATVMTTRGFRFGTDEPNRNKRAGIMLGVWNANFSISKSTGAANSSEVVREDLNFSRTKYLKPVGKVDFTEGNAAGDWDEPGRGDYSVALSQNQANAGTGLGVVFQEVLVRASLRTQAGRYGQLTISNDQGRVKLKAIVLEGDEAVRRDGIQI